MLDTLWATCKRTTPHAFSVQLPDHGTFTFHRADAWASLPFHRPLALLEAAVPTSNGWHIHLASRKDCDISELLTRISRDQHGQLALPHGTEAFYDSVNDIFRVYDVAEKRAALIYPHAHRFAEWDLHSPFREFWHLWALANGGLLVHSGMICVGDTAVLLPGAGGSGKSTTVLSCLAAGMTTTGDEYNLLLPDNDGAFTAIPLYANLKMKLPCPFDFPLLRAYPAELLDYANKRIFYPPASAPIWNRYRPRVKGILHPTIGAAAPSITPLAQSEVLRQLAVSSIMQSPFRAKEYLARAGALAQRTRAARQHLSGNVQQNAQCVRAWAEAL